MLRQETLTTLIEVPRAQVAKVKAALGSGHIGQPAMFRLPTIHFARLVLIEEPETSIYRSWLLLESNFDTPEPPENGQAARKQHLSELSEHAFSELAPVARLCTDQPLSTPRDLADALFAGYREHTVRYQGHVYRDVRRIHLEAKLRRFCLDFVRPRPTKAPGDHRWSGALWRALYAAARAEPELADLDLGGPAPKDPRYDARVAMLKMPTALIYARAWWPLLRYFALLPTILFHERRDPEFQPQRFLETRSPRDRRIERENAASEDWMAQNALTHLVPLREGILRRQIFDTSHATLAIAARTHFDFTGELGGIPTIHFAKWLLADEGRRLLFLSNYDGNWESYIGDFVDQAAAGLNLAWSCSAEYPSTKAIFGGGAADEERFKVWTRAYQRPTQVFYSAYPELSVGDINQATWVRFGLHNRPPTDLEAWARRLV